MSEVDAEATSSVPSGEVSVEASFSQADVDRIVADRLQREKAKFADYDALKAKAGESKSLEDRLADVEARYAQAELGRVRSDVAARFGIGAEDRDLFLTGSDEDSLTAQAKRLVERESDRKKQGNVAPREGVASIQGDKDSGLRDVTRRLFASAQND